MKKNIIELPEDFDSYSHLEKEKWFMRYVVKYMREGEIYGLRDDVSDDIKEAYQKFLGE